MTDRERLLEALRQIYGIAQEGISAPNAAYRWCARIDEIFWKGGPIPEYEAFSQDMPDQFSAALATLKAPEGEEV